MMPDVDYDEITRVVLTRLSDQLRRVVQDLEQPRSETLTQPEEARPSDERVARHRNELIAKLRRR